MDKIIICKNCGKPVDIDEAMRHQFAEIIRKEEEENARIKFEKQKTELLSSERKKALEEVESKNRQKDKELQKEREEKLELEKKFARQLEEKEKEKAKIKEEARKDADEKHRLEKLEWEKQKISMQKTVDELQRKGKQGSQQLQGDVLELDLEERLRDAFPYDEFKPVPTGIRGGDIIHEIRNKHGNIAGKILWEAKRQKAWNKAWLTKLKDDMRKIDASDCILVTDILPTNIRVYDRIDNVWVTSYEYAIKLVSVLRLGLLNVAIAKSSASHTDEQLKDLYRIITSDSFRNKFEARREIIQRMRQELESEQASTERRWKRQAATIDALSKNNREIYGELEAHIPSLKPLGDGETLELQSGDEEENQTKFS